MVVGWRGIYLGGVVGIVWVRVLKVESWKIERVG